MALEIDRQSNSTTILLKWLEAAIEAPTILAVAELMFYVQLARTATRETIYPLKVKTPNLPEQLDKYTEYIGVRMQRNKYSMLTFSARDTKRPFLTSNQAMWQFF